MTSTTTETKTTTKTTKTAKPAKPDWDAPPRTTWQRTRWIWPRRSTERTLSGMGFVVTGQEDAAVLAERVRLALATYKARRAA